MLIWEWLSGISSISIMFHLAYVKAQPTENAKTLNLPQRVTAHNGIHLYTTVKSVWLSACSLWSTGCTVPTTLCKQPPTAPSTVWSIRFTHHWWICGTRVRWRPISRRLGATWACQRWWSPAFVFPPERRWWEQSTPPYWSSRRKKRRSRWGNAESDLHIEASLVCTVRTEKCKLMAAKRLR